MPELEASWWEIVGYSPETRDLMVKTVRNDYHPEKVGEVCPYKPSEMMDGVLLEAFDRVKADAIKRIELGTGLSKGLRIKPTVKKVFGGNRPRIIDEIQRLTEDEEKYILRRSVSASYFSSGPSYTCSIGFTKSVFGREDVHFDIFPKTGTFREYAVKADVYPADVLRIATAAMEAHVFGSYRA